MAKAYLPLLFAVGQFVTIGNFRPDNPAATRPRAVLRLGEPEPGRPVGEHRTSWERWRADRAASLAPRRWRPE